MFMPLIFTLSLIVMMTSCNALPQLFQATEEIANNDVVDLTISKDAIQKDVNVSILIKDDPAAK